MTGIGDSVMLGAAPKLRARLPGITIDAQVGRPMASGLPVIKELRASGRLRSVVVFGLGTNGPFDAGLLRRTLDALGNRSVLLVNTRAPRSWQDPVNRMLRQAARDRPRVDLVDWHTAAKGASQALASDGIHLRPAGASLYANLIVKSLCTSRR